MRIEIQQNIGGKILDIGGGGEGIIGQIFKENVIAIDNRQEELDEAPDCCEKRLMDASNLTFDDDSFDSVTFFYSLMYMTRDTQEKAIYEASRVLKKKGKIYIWDTDIQSANPVPYIVHLDISIGQSTIHASYGIVKDDPQGSDKIMRLLEQCGLILEDYAKTEGQFSLCYRKE